MRSNIIKGAQILLFATYALLAIIRSGTDKARIVILLMLISVNIILILYNKFLQTPVNKFSHLIKQPLFWWGLIFYFLDNSKFWVLSWVNVAKLLVAGTFLWSLFFYRFGWDKTSMPESGVIKGNSR